MNVPIPSELPGCRCRTKPLPPDEEDDSIRLTAGSFHLFVYMDCPYHGPVLRRTLNELMGRISVVKAVGV